MALSQAAALVERAIGHLGTSETPNDISNPAVDRKKYADPSGETMKALVWNGKGSVKVVDTPKPRIVEPTDVLIQVTGSTVCGSDLHLYHGAILQLEKGDILGHEFMGKVESFGSEVKNLKVGQRVVASFQIACGHCMYCDQKLSSMCTKTNENKTENALYGGVTAGFFGYSHLVGGFAGGQAEYVRVPLGHINLLPIPDDIPDEKALFLSDVVPTSWNCVVDTGVKKGDVVAIWGAGPIGLMAAQFSFYNGARRVIIIDGGPASWRLDYCKQKLPNLETLNFTDLPKGESITSALKKMEPEGPDVALECVAGEYPKGWAHYFEMMFGLETDTSEIVNEMITSVKSFGRCGITGAYVGYTNHFNIGALMERGIKLHGNGQAPVHKYWEDLLQKIQKNEIQPLDMVSHRVDIEDLEQVYKIFEEKKEHMQKVFVQTKFSDPPCPGAPSLTRFN